MILSDGSIRESVQDGEIDVEPEPTGNQYQPASLDLRLGDSYRDTSDGTLYEEVDEITVQPEDFFHCKTKEKISLPPYLAAEVEGRSSFGREGLLIHITAGWLDPGFTGDITLEVANVSQHPVEIAVDERICQVVFHRMEQPAELPYGHEERDSKYQGQQGPTQSKR